MLRQQTLLFPEFEFDELGNLLDVAQKVVDSEDTYPGVPSQDPSKDKTSQESERCIREYNDKKSH